ncbi:2-isopropylmalate synthase [Trichinella spiralis]|uniref:2-isopropylmalate synthase n=1 Tax=Trichinella spiralis TaxID=6334 RepID=A0ABR3KXM0_TRISP
MSDLNVVSMVSSIAYRRSGTCGNIVALLNIIYDEEISHGLQWNITYMCHEEQKRRKKTDKPLQCRQLELFL